MPYQRYRAVLATCARRLGERLSLPITEAGVARFSASVPSWPAFADSHDALLRLQSRYQLAVITNSDDDLFAASSRRLGIWFDWVVTALQAGSYKPDPHNFHVAFERIGVPPERILHVAQSLFHDHAPANRLGLTSVWINRRAGRPGTGATPPTEATPAAEFPSLAAFADTVVA